MLQKSAVAGTFLALAFSFAFGADLSSTATKMTAEQVVERNVAARGGLRSWRAVQTLSMSGQMEAGGNDRSLRSAAAPALRPGGLQTPRRPLEQAQLPFRIDLKRGRKLRLELDFRGQTAIQVYDGVNGWKLRPFLNRHEVEPYSPEEMKAAALQADLDGPLVDYAAKGTKVELEGSEKVEGKENYRLKLTMKNGQTQRVWVDAGTFLETKMEGAPRRLDGKYHSVETFLRDYRSVNGLMVPYLLETKVQGVPQTEKIKIETVTINPKLEDSRFAKVQ
jgi:outer membrane lipoprotein-sorting protein